MSPRTAAVALAIVAATASPVSERLGEIGTADVSTAAVHRSNPKRTIPTSLLVAQPTRRAVPPGDNGQSQGPLSINNATVNTSDIGVFGLSAFGDMVGIALHTVSPRTGGGASVGNQSGFDDTSLTYILAPAPPCCSVSPRSPRPAAVWCERHAIPP